MASDKKVSVVVVVNTEDVTLEANVNEPVRVVAEKALKMSESGDHKLSDFELKDANGRTLDPNEKLSVALAAGAKLFLTLPVGVTG